MGSGERMVNRLPLIILMALILSGFQNCTGLSSSGDSSQSSEAGTKSSGIQGLDDGGQPYDGKPFVFKQTCPDGTLVASRIVLSADGKTSQLQRDACVTGSPRDLAASEITSASGGQIRYQGRLYQPEKPVIPMPGLVDWIYQLTGTVQSPAKPSFMIIDLFENSAAKIQSFIGAGHTVICSVSAGTKENWRPDAASFKSEDVGRSTGSSGERWIDTRSTNVRSIMLARLDLAKSKGCQGIDFDSVDGYQNNTGFPLDASTQLEYNRFLAFAAHDRQLVMALNNAPGLAVQLAEIFDLAIAEQCFQYGECDQYSPFINRGKPVLAAEYTAFSSAQCSQARDLQISLSFFNEELDGSVQQSCGP